MAAEGASVFAGTPCDLSSPADITFAWHEAFPQGDVARLRRLHQVLLQLDRNPALVDVCTHARAVGELARLVAVLLPDDADSPLTAAVPLLFRQGHVECNCVLFEFTQRVQHLAERLLLLAHFNDTGGPAHPPGLGAPLVVWSASEHQARAEAVRRVVGLLNLALKWARLWTDVPPVCGGPRVAYWRDLLACVRAYGLWNTARAQMGGCILLGPLDREEEPDTTPERLLVLLGALEALVEAWRTLPTHSVRLADGVLELVPSTVTPLDFNTDVLSPAERETHDARLTLSVEPRASDPWHVGVVSHLLHVWADTRAAMGEHGLALGLARLLARRADSHRRLAQWETFNRRVLLQPVPSAADVKAALQAFKGCPDALRAGLDPLTEGPPLRVC